MSLKNINEIQSNVYSTLDKEFAEHTIGSLANIGQRFSEPGEGITTTSFGIADIFPEITGQTSYIKCHINDDCINVYSENSDLPSAIILNNIVINKLLDTDENGTVDIDTGINKDINKDNNILYLNKSDGLLKYIYEDINKTEPIFDELSESTEVISSYTCHICSINKTSINNVTYFLPEQYYKIINYKKSVNDYNHIIYKYELISNSNNNINNINDYQYEVSKVIDSSAYNINNLLNHDNEITVDNLNYQIIDTYNIQFDSTVGELWLVNKGNNKDNEIILHDYLNNELHNSKEFDSLNKVINIYNNIYTNDIKVNIFKYLLYDIFNSYTHETDYYTDSSKTELDVYLPFDYKFNFYSSSIELNHFYSSVSDIILKKCVNINNNDISDYINSNNQIVADWSKLFGKKTDDNVYDIYDQYVLYNISIDYNNKTYEIIPNSYYTLPYINKYNHWVINGIESTISAIGVTNDTGFIIIDSRNELQVDNNDNNDNNDNKENNTDTQNLTDNEYKVNPVCLSPMYQDEINKNIGFEQGDLYTVTVDDYSAKSGQSITIGCGLPKISDINNTSVNLDAVNFIKSSPILVISEYKINNELYYVTTIWVWDKANSKFITITNEDGEVYDLYKLGNISNIVKNNLKNINEEPGRFLHQQLVFEPITKIFKQSYIIGNIYPGIQNIFSYTKDNIYGIKPVLGKGDSSNAIYNNRANLVPGFWNKFELSYSNRYNDCTLALDCSFNDANNFTFNSSNKLSHLGIITYQNPLTGEYYSSYDYIPNVENSETQYISQMDLSGLFLRHTNNLNRTNILSIDSTGYVYYSYIGTSYIDTDKSILKIGSYNMNIDLSNAAMSYKENGKFQKQETIQFDFKNINIASDTLNILNGNLTINGKILDIGAKFIPQKIHDNLYTIPILPVFPINMTSMYTIDKSTISPTTWFVNKENYINITYNFKIQDYINALLLDYDSTIKMNFNSGASAVVPLTADPVKFTEDDIDYYILQPMTLVAYLDKKDNINYYSIEKVILGHNDYNYI